MCFQTFPGCGGTNRVYDHLVSLQRHPLPVSCDVARNIGVPILALARKPANGRVLAMDRTNWQFGKTHINLLAVTVILNGVGLPVAWKMLPKTTKRGNSSLRPKILSCSVEQASNGVSPQMSSPAIRHHFPHHFGKGLVPKVLRG